MDLKSLIEAFRRRLPTPSSASTPVSDRVVADSELVSRFLTQSNHQSGGRPHARAFEPIFDSERGRFETSVFRTSNLSTAEVFRIGAVEVEAVRQKQIIGRAAILVQVVREHELDVISDEPPTRHAVIIGWPGTPDREKSARKALQQRLASAAVLDSHNGP